MNGLTQLYCLTLGALGSLLLGTAAEAVQVSDGTRYFNRVPTLVSNQAYERNFNASARYTFTIALPADAGESLGRVEIDLGEFGSDYSVDTGRTVVHDLEQRRMKVKNASVSDPRSVHDNPVVSVELAEPLEPGKTAVIRLHVVTSRIGGVHLVGVTAFPAGDKAHGQFLGFGRIHVWDN